MRRWALRIVSCLLLGCVTTVAVAWACLLAKPQPHHNYDNQVAFETENNRGWWIGTVESGRGWRMCALYADLPWITGGRVTPDPLPRWADLAHHRPVFADGEVFARISCGWPKICCFARQRGTDNSAAAAARGLVSTGIGPAEVARDDWQYAINLRPGDLSLERACPALPFGLILPGFVINTLFYSAIWFGMFFGFSSGRRNIRKNRGRCPKCAYDLRSQFDDGCSECGWNRPEDDA